ncbi:MAG: SDR family NAD(P)-dependent oxidoreductase [Acidimicrobiia bacterium]|nr:SDR family NAD(P)-dependent oxidoreductase [Acidimicrobiia bacterium]
MDRSGQVAVVTGAAGGIGRGLARRFGADGMRVVAADVDESLASETAELVRGDGGEALAVRVDVADAGSVEALAEAVYLEYGAANILCNNAGVFQGGFLWETEQADWDWVMGVNVYGVINGIRSFVPRMIEGGQWGHIVNTASVAAWVSSATAGPYAVSKMACLGVSEVLAKELAAVGAPIGVSVLTPSAVATGIGSSERNRPEDLVAEQTPTAVAVREGLRAMVAEGLDPSEVADIVVAAIEADQFLIPTRPSFQAQLQVRFDALLAKELPGDPIID